MQPAAQKVADNAESVAEDIIKKVIDPAVEVSHALNHYHSCHTELHWLQCFLRGAAQSCVRLAGPAKIPQRASQSCLAASASAFKRSGVHGQGNRVCLTASALVAV